MILRSIPVAVVGLTLSLALGGCNCQTVKPAECHSDGECGKGQVCGPSQMCVTLSTCPTVACTADQKCLGGVPKDGGAQAGTCYSTSCGSKKCAADQACVSNTCTDDGCVGLSCNGQTCVKSQCFPAQCDPDNGMCTMGEVCGADGLCMPKICVGVNCAAGDACAADGNCYPTGRGTGGGGTGTGGGGTGTGGGGTGTGGGGTGTGGGGTGTGGGSGGSACGGQCSPVQVCVAGVCRELRCIGIVCPMGFACAQGACTPTDCGGVPCPVGQVCGVMGTCTTTECAGVTCPGGYTCRQGFCTVGQSDGGIPRLPDGGPGVIYGPDGGIIGIVGPDGGVLLGPDGGPIGGGCQPGRCSEIDCNDGIDNDSNGAADCADPSCNSLTCTDGVACTFGERCSGGACLPATTLVCNMPPPGGCWGTACRADGTCVYPAKIGYPCGDGGSCLPDGGCRAGPSQGKIEYVEPPTNFDPNSLNPPVGEVLIPDGTSATFNSDTNTFSGSWGTPLPAVSTVTLSNGQQASVLATEKFTVGFNASLHLTGSRPVIFATFNTATINGTIDAAANLNTPGPGGNHSGCATAGTGQPGSAGTYSAAGGGGAGAKTPGAVGGSGSFGGGIGGTPGAARGSANPVIGGCPGGRGGNTGGLPGAGGGAVQISSSSVINITDGGITVNGGGGSGGLGLDRGGGGAGSAGGIMLEAGVVEIGAAFVVANGGAGGQGSVDGVEPGGWSFDAGLLPDGGLPDGGVWDGGGFPLAGAGGNGENGRRATTAAQGGWTNWNGGRGGNGGARSGGPTAGQPGFSYWWLEGGGGGGGAAAGFIYVHLFAPGVCDATGGNSISPQIVDSKGGTCNN